MELNRTADLAIHVSHNVKVDGMPVNDNTQKVGDNFPGYSFRRGRFLPSGQLLYRLFFQPQVLLGLRDDHWARPFRMICLLCILSGIAVGVFHIPTFLKTTNEWATWLQDNVERVRIQEGQIHWKRPKELPATLWHKGLHISFHSSESTFEAKEMKNREEQNRGIWINPTAIYAWRKTSDDSIHPFPIFEDGKLRGALSAGKIWPEEIVLEGKKFQEFAHSFLFIFVPLVMLKEALLLLLPTLLYTAIFALIPVVLHNPFWFNRSFSSVYGFYLYAAIPAVLLTAFFRCLHIDVISTSGLFVICFIAYLFLAFYHIRKEFVQNK